jgi:hypothetical protein
MDEGRNMTLLFPPLIEGINTTEGRETFKASCHMFYPQRVVDFPDDGIVKWKGLDNNSDLVNEEGAVLVKHEPGMREEDMDAKKRQVVEFANRDKVKAIRNEEN